ncbi:glycoside hydrolase family 88/105 protein [Ructibacterium gallinarum]|uniref:Glycoside hydrolase family 88 protein n=1 Tax=Ructibacterium gallinarum TaxID=2779355 RepID=A0A9D5M2H2_9FIRM|nr:glycoside hydrolase family 88 protein [Ructibacterium gallinarum]MBE5041100.1 glycoside hydrolase family 88 protein [Ructibacterium gallinarum]
MCLKKCQAIGCNITNTANILSIIANRYTADNPPIPFSFRGFSEAGQVQCSQNGSYHIDFSLQFPDAPRGAYAYVATRIYAKQNGPHGILLTSPGGTELYVDGNLLYRSSVQDEQAMGRQNHVEMELKQGWHDLFFKCKNVCRGQFWVTISGNSPKWAPMLFYAPFQERMEQCGFASTTCFESDIFEVIPSLSEQEIQNPSVIWYPVQTWDKEQLQFSPSYRLFGHSSAMAWAKLQANYAENIYFSVHADDKILLYTGGQIYTAENGSLEINITLSPGEHDVLIYGKNFSIGTNASLKLPPSVQGVPAPWLYLGPLSDNLDLSNPIEFCTLYRLFDGQDGPTYWRADLPHMVIRPCLENTGFGKWSYPYGVTLYGLLEAARMLKRQDLIDYTKAHANQCVQLYAYSRWDKETYGYPNINQQLLWFSALDDVGSFGSFVLESTDGKISEAIHLLSKNIADYIQTKVERTPEGAFFRLNSSCAQTMWADDLYMSVPFLVRYATLFQDTAALDDAAKQFLLYRKYLYMENEHLFSHVYDFRRKAQSYVPWGRGNGWALFSLSELLLHLEKTHPLYADLIDLFQEFSDGILTRQGTHGLWHQVINDASTYEETSCTAMIICAFSRGIRLGILDAQKYAKAVFRAWEGLTLYAIDTYGNVHGVCRGSFYSFDPEYYRDLNPITNDPHGVGIVLLSGVEVLRLQDTLKQKKG